MKTMHSACRAALLDALPILPLQWGSAQVPHLLQHQGRIVVDGVNFNGSGRFKFALVDAGTNTSRQATAEPVVAFWSITSVTVIDGGAGYTSEPTATVRDIKGGGSGARLRAVVSGGAVTAITVLDGGSGYTPAASIDISAPPPNIVYQTFWGNAPDTTPTDGEPDAAVTLAVTNGLYEVLLGDTSLPNMEAIPATVFTNPDVRLRVWFDDGTHGFQMLCPDKRIAAVGYALMAENVPDGAITQPKTAAGAAGTNQLATGAVTTANIADGAVTSTHLAKPPRSGSITGSSLTLQFNQAPFTVNFATAFATTPVVTLAPRTGSGEAWTPSAWITAVGTSSFSGLLSIPVTPLTADSVNNVGQHVSMAIVNSRPAMAYYDDTGNQIMFVRASDTDGTAWGTPVLVDTNGNVGQYASLAMVNGNPAIAYYEATNGKLMHARATDVDGTAWGAPSTLDGSINDVGHGVSMATVSGNPAIAYGDFTGNSYPKYIRASNASGTVWAPPVTVSDTGSSERLVGRICLAAVGSNPAIAYYDSSYGGVYFVRASNTTGST